MDIKNILTEEKTKLILFGNSEYKDWYNSFIKILPSYNINTVERISMFLAQTCHESSNYTRLEENLNYSYLGLLKTFKKYFSSEKIAKLYEKKKEKIANKVYGNRYGNGNELSGDGYKFRGRGPIQITFKNNYENFSKFLFGDDRVVKNPDLILINKDICVHSACWFWYKNNLNNSADKKDITTNTKIINGGNNGLKDRIIKYNFIINILKT